MASKEGKLTVCGPVRDGQFTVWVVRGPRGGQVGEFLTREAARRYVRSKRAKKSR